MQWRVFRIGAGIARDNAELRDGHKQFGCAIVVQLHEFHIAIAKIHIDEAHVATYAVIVMHHRVTDINLG